MEAKGPLIKMTGEGDKEGRVSKKQPACSQACNERANEYME